MKRFLNLKLLFFDANYHLGWREFFIDFQSLVSCHHVSGLSFYEFSIFTPPTSCLKIIMSLKNTNFTLCL